MFGLGEVESIVAVVAIGLALLLALAVLAAAWPID